VIANTTGRRRPARIVARFPLCLRTDRPGRGPTAATEAAVQSNITSAGYADYTLPGNPFTNGAVISLRATTPCWTRDYLTGDTSGGDLGAKAVTSSSSSTLKADATWIVEPGLANSACVSFKSDHGSGD
jgi:non-reducing end alpha-L-arabinofuranosidase